ncbi:hypothetical protein ACT436_08660 [Acinetobacter baumannii]
MDRKQFEVWFKGTDGYKLLEEMNYFKIDLFTFKEHRSQYQHTTVQIAYMTWQHQQAKVEEQAQEIANLKSLIQGHELRHQQNLSIKQKLTRRSEELQTLYTQQGINMFKLQKRVDSLEKAEFKLAQVKAILQNNPKLLESILVKKIEQALNGGEPK